MNNETVISIEEIFRVNESKFGTDLHDWSHGLIGTVWVIGDSQILVSFNYGMTWRNFYGRECELLPSEQPFFVRATTSDHCWLGTRDAYSVVRVYLTEDCGKTWKNCFTSDCALYYARGCADREGACISVVGKAMPSTSVTDTLFQSLDHGLHWQRTSLDVSGNAMMIEIMGDGSGILWTHKISPPHPNVSPAEVDRIFSTQDGGVSWSNLMAFRQEHLTHVQFSSDSTNRSLVVWTSDGVSMTCKADQWSERHCVFPEVSIRDVSMLNQKGAALGDSEDDESADRTIILMTTEDDGESWTKRQFESQELFFKVQMLSGNDGLLLSNSVVARFGLAK